MEILFVLALGAVIGCLGTILFFVHEGRSYQRTADKG